MLSTSLVAEEIRLPDSLGIRTLFMLPDENKDLNINSDGEEYPPFNQFKKEKHLNMPELEAGGLTISDLAVA